MSKYRTINFWGRRINTKNASSIADKLNVDEEKIKELANGEREIEGETFDKVLQAVEEEKIHQPMKNVEILQWYRDTDLKAVRLKFGYKSQVELAKALDCNASTICNFEKKAPLKGVSVRLIQLYEFFHNDFNRKTTKEKLTKRDNIYLWYTNTDITKLRKNANITQKDFARQLGMSQSCLHDVENHKMLRLNKSIIKVYNFFNKENAEEIKETPTEKLNEIYSWYANTKDLREYSRKFGYSKNKLMSELNLSWDQIKDFESHKYKSATAVVVKAYEFFHNEKNRLPEVKINENLKKRWDKKKEKVEPVEPIYAEPIYNENNNVANYYQVLTPEDTSISYTDTEYTNDVLHKQIEELKEEIISLTKKIEELNNKNFDLHMQIVRYEKLIDRL